MSAVDPRAAHESVAAIRFDAGDIQSATRLRRGAVIAAVGWTLPLVLALLTRISSDQLGTDDELWKVSKATAPLHLLAIGMVVFGIWRLTFALGGPRAAAVRWLGRVLLFWAVGRAVIVVASAFWFPSAAMFGALAWVAHLALIVLLARACRAATDGAARVTRWGRLAFWSWLLQPAPLVMFATVSAGAVSLPLILSGLWAVSALSAALMLVETGRAAAGGAEVRPLPVPVVMGLAAAAAALVVGGGADLGSPSQRARDDWMTWQIARAEYGCCQTGPQYAERCVDGLHALLRRVDAEARDPGLGPRATAELERCPAAHLLRADPSGRALQTPARGVRAALERIDTEEDGARAAMLLVREPTELIDVLTAALDSGRELSPGAREALKAAVDKARGYIEGKVRFCTGRKARTGEPDSACTHDARVLAGLDALVVRLDPKGPTPGPATGRR